MVRKYLRKLEISKKGIENGRRRMEEGVSRERRYR